MTAPETGFVWVSGGLTDPGRVRKSNQDALLDRPDLGLWVVADGMGGHQAGDQASRMLVEQLSALGHRGLLGAAVGQVCEMLTEVNQRLVAQARALGVDTIGSTVVVLLAVGAHCSILWVGDSRVYRLRAGTLVQLTRDHSQVQELVDQGQLAPEDAERHPWANVLVRAVGGGADLAIDRRIESLRDGDRYLLCSDGLTRELGPGRMRELLARGGAPESARSLVEAAVDAGGRDNVTALVIDFREGPRRG